MMLGQIRHDDLGRASSSRRSSPTRWFSYQPNVPGRGIVAPYGARFWGIVVVLGVASAVT
jgi:hypothetical protein